MVEEVGKERQAKLFWDKGWWMRQWRRLPPRLRITMNSNWFRLWAALWRGADHPAAYFVLFLSPPAGDYTGIEISTWHERSGLGFRSRRGRDRGWAVSTASTKRSVTGALLWRAPTLQEHTGCCLQYRPRPTRATSPPPSLWWMLGEWRGRKDENT